MAKPTNSLVKAIHKNDPRRFHTRVRASLKQPRLQDNRCDCDKQCMCWYEEDDE